MCSPNAGVVGTCDRILYDLVLHDFPDNQVFFLWRRSLIQATIPKQTREEVRFDEIYVGF